VECTVDRIVEEIEDVPSSPRRTHTSVLLVGLFEYHKVGRSLWMHLLAVYQKYVIDGI